MTLHNTTEVSVDTHLKTYTHLHNRVLTSVVAFIVRESCARVTTTTETKSAETSTRERIRGVDDDPEEVLREVGEDIKRVVVEGQPNLTK